ncbi:MAG: S-layer homology domain-containing protein [Bacillota bacterium]|nr:S-layer homology domain-containing protein [Bacillota bacterium]
MSTIRRTTLGNLALLLFVTFLFQVVAALASPTNASALTGVSVVEEPRLPEQAITIKLRLSPLTPPQWDSVFVKLTVYRQGQVFTISRSVYELVYETVYPTVYATVYSDPRTEANWVLLGLTYRLPEGVTLVTGDSIVLSVYEGANLLFTRSWPVPTPPPEPVVTVPVPTTVPTDTGVLRIDPTRDEAILKVDPVKVEAQLKDPKVTEVRMGIPPTVSTATMAVDIPPAVLTGSQTYGKPLVAELGATGQVELKPGTVTAEDLKYRDDRGVERQGNLRIAASRLSQDEAAPLLAKVDKSQFGNQQPVAQVYEVQAQVVADDKVVGTARPKKPVVLVLTFDKGKVEASGAPVEATMIYVWNEAAGTWDPCASKVDPVTGKASTVRPTLSKYTVMAYRRTFADIAGHWAQRDIEIMAGRFVARGVTPTTFLPNGKVTRAQFAAFLQRALGIPEEKPAQPTFSDVAPDAWYYGAVEGLAKAGLVLGWQGKFRPDDLVTREEMATMVVRGIAYDGKKVTLTGQEVEELLARFTDRGSISDWAKESAAIAVKAGVVLGRAVDSESPVYAPKDDAMRAEAVTMIKRLLKYLGWF